jgi:hypothetical protein
MTYEDCHEDGPNALRTKVITKSLLPQIEQCCQCRPEYNIFLSPPTLSVNLLDVTTYLAYFTEVEIRKQDPAVQSL